jgi:hypothetical protein
MSDIKFFDNKKVRNKVWKYKNKTQIIKIL